MKKTLLILMAVVMVGCGVVGGGKSSWERKMETTWVPRVAHYTYARTLTELGPPDSKETVDGYTYAAWNEVEVLQGTSWTYKTVLVFGADNILKSAKFTER